MLRGAHLAEFHPNERRVRPTEMTRDNGELRFSHGSHSPARYCPPPTRMTKRNSAENRDPSKHREKNEDWSTLCVRVIVGLSFPVKRQVTDLGVSFQVMKSREKKTKKQWETRNIYEQLFDYALVTFSFLFLINIFFLLLSR